MKRATLGLLAAVAITAGAFGLSAGPVSGQTSSEEFQNVDEVESFTVPADVCAVTIEARGAGGGGLENNALKGPGGTGGLAIATLPVTAGEELLVAVGERGVATFDDTGGPGGASGGQPSGGDGGDSVSAPPGSAIGGSGGGGASSVTRAADGEPLIVAGGGGGGGITRAAAGPPGGGGDGGGPAGDDGTDGGGGGGGASGGDGGTPTTPGAGGALQFPGQTAVGVVGGTGASPDSETVGNGGGGGGGGFQGGGGGGASNGANDGGGGGGGGSGFAAANATDVTLTAGGNPDENREGLVVISWTPGVGCAGPTPAPAIVLEPTFTG